MRTYTVITANSAFWQSHTVTAADEPRAVALAVDAANAARILDEEARMAAAVGQDAPGRYALHAVRDERAPESDGEGCTFCDAGANG